MSFVSRSVQYAIRNALRKAKHHSTLDWTIKERRKIPKTLLADKNIQKSDYRFNEHARFTIIDRLTNANLDKKKSKENVSFKEKTIEYKN